MKRLALFNALLILFLAVLPAVSGTGWGNAGFNDGNGGGSTFTLPATGSFSADPATLPNFRKAVGKVLAGSGNAYVLVDGDSTMGTTGLSGANQVYAYSPPGQLRKVLNSNSIPSAEWWVFPSSQQTESRLTAGTGWSIEVGFGLGNQCNANGVDGATGNLSFAPGYAFDTIQVMYTKNPGLGTCTINVDGGSSLGNIIENGTAGLYTASFSVSKGTHTVNITGPTGGQVYIVGLWCYDSTTPAVFVANGGFSGANSGHFVNNFSGVFGTTYATALMAPDLTFVDLTINDAVNIAQGSSSQATWKSNIASLITTLQGQNSDVILVSGLPTNPALVAGLTAVQAALDTALSSLSTTYNCAYLSLFKRFGSWSAANTLGLMTDDYHPNNIGAADNGMALFNLIRTAAAGGGPFGGLSAADAVSITGANSSQPVLTVTGAASQSVPTQQWVEGSGQTGDNWAVYNGATKLAHCDVNGNIASDSGNVLAGGSGGKIGLLNGGQLSITPQTAPGNPASGWLLYCDSGDGNKLKAKASTGTVVTLGTP